MKTRNAKMRWSVLLFIGMTAAWEGAAAQGELGGEGWGYKFKPVMGWKHAGTEDALIILGHDTLPGMVFVYPHQEAGMAVRYRNSGTMPSQQTMQALPATNGQRHGGSATCPPTGAGGRTSLP